MVGSDDLESFFQPRRLNSMTMSLERDCEGLMSPPPRFIASHAFIPCSATSVKMPYLTYLEVPVLPFLMPVLVFLVKAKGYLHP